MKNMRKVLMLTAISLVAAISCQRETVLDENPAAKENVPEGWNKVIIPFETAATKTELEGSAVKWSEGDKVRILFANSEAAGTSGTVEDDMINFFAPDSVSTFYAVYPYADSVALDGENLRLTIPSEVDGSFAAANYMAARTEKDGAFFHFKHICALLKIQMPTGFKAVKVRSNIAQNEIWGGNQYIGGEELVSFVSDDSVSVKTLNGEELSVAVNASGFAAGTVYIPVVPDACCQAGIGFCLTDNAGNESGALSTASVKFSLGGIIDAGDVSSRIHDWYIKTEASGKGDGSSWENAAGPAFLLKLFSRNFQKGETVYSYNGTPDAAATKAVDSPNFWRLQGRTIHLAAGTYDLYDELEKVSGSEGTPELTPTVSGFSFNVKGGYSADGSTYDPSAYKANFTNSGSALRVMTLSATLGKCVVSGVSVNGLPATLKGEGAALLIGSNSSTGMEDGEGLVFENCDFSANTGLTNKGLFRNSSAGATRLVFRNCTVSNNSSTKSGSFYNATSPKSELVMENCTVSGNKGSSSAIYGGVFYFGGHAVEFNGCKFSANTCESTGSGRYGSGGVIYVSSDGADIRIDNCLFEDNTARYGADLYLASSDATPTSCYINRSSFVNYASTASSNSDKYYGISIASSTAQTTICINNSSFGGFSSASKTVGCHVGFKGDGILLNSTIVGSGTQCLRLDGTISSGKKDYVVNNLLVHTTDGNPINQSNSSERYGFYNLLKSGKNTYASLAETDCNYVKYSNFSKMEWMNNHWEWVLDSTIVYPARPTLAKISTLVKSAFPDFDNWLKTRQDSPYGADQNGNTRNAALLRPGAWDDGNFSPQVEATEEQDTLRIFGVGNSWTRDSYRYISAIAAHSGKKVIVGHAYLGGSSLENQYFGIDDPEYCYSHDGTKQKVHSTYQYWKYYFSDNPSYEPSSGYSNGLAGIGVTLERCVTDEPWDIIIFQPSQSVGMKLDMYLGRDTTSTFSMLKLVNRVKQMMDPDVASKVKVGVLISWSYPDGCTTRSNSIQSYYDPGSTATDQTTWNGYFQQLHESIQTNFPIIAESINADYLINVGKAIYEGRQNADLADNYGYKLQRAISDTHLSEGLPKYLASLMFAYEFLGLTNETITWYPETSAGPTSTTQTGSDVSTVASHAKTARDIAWACYQSKQK